MEGKKNTYIENYKSKLVLMYECWINVSMTNFSSQFYAHSKYSTKSKGKKSMI